MWDTLINKPDTVHARTNLLYWNGWAKLEAIRAGDSKLFLGKVDAVQDSDKGPVLIDLKSDPAETTNQAQQHPEMVKEMEALAKKLTADIEADSIPLGGPPATK